MDIADFLAPENVFIDVRAIDKGKLLRDLANRAAKALDLPADDILAAIEKRESLGSTGIGNGISTPHARMAGMSAPFGFLARLKVAVDFDSIDGQPVDIVFVLLLPATSQPGQLNALAAVARKLRDADVVHKIRNASNSRSLYQAISETAQHC